MLAVLAGFKLTLAPANDLVAGQDTATTLARLIDFSRYRLIAFKYVGFAWTFPVLILIGYGMLLRSVPRVRQQAGLPGLVLLFMASGYFLIYLTTPIQLEQHLDTSLKRILLHMWPLALLSFFLWARSPEDPEEVAVSPEPRVPRPT